MIMSLAHVVRSSELLFLHGLQALVHGASGVPDSASSLFKCLLGGLHVLVAGFFGWGRNLDVQLKGMVRVRLGRQGQI